ncbi:MAG: DUF6899 family protein [Bacteriovoracaceae bacterium]
MPYIKNEQRNKILIDKKVFIDEINNAGELNYTISIIIKNYFNKEDKGNYQAINDIIGALEGAKLEFTRRITNDYEDLKIKENGDMYE